jgi:hypothetical protein
VSVVVRVVAFAVGLVIVQGVLRSAVRTVVVPRGEAVLLSRGLFLAVRAVYDPLARRHRDAGVRHAVLARYAPTALVLLAFVWAAGIIVGFAPMYWATTELDLAAAFRLSGSSMTTLGLAAPPNALSTGLAVLEALLGLGIVALLIAYLPTIYGHFSRREEEVLKFDSQAGSPPSPTTFLIRLHAIGWADHLGQVWEPWERWFDELEESHTSHPSIALFRSQRVSDSWITTAGAVLDTAALSEAAVDVPGQPQAALTLRAGFLSLRAIAHYHGLAVNDDPEPSDPISVTRAEFDEVLDEISAAGVRVKADRDQAWRDFAGWRVNYDEALLALSALCAAPVARWSSDRCDRYHPPTLRHPRAWRIEPLDAPRSW